MAAPPPPTTQLAHEPDLGLCVATFVVLLLAWWALGSVTPGTPLVPAAAAPGAEPAAPQRFDTDEAQYLAMGLLSLRQALGQSGPDLDGRIPIEPFATGEAWDPWRVGVHATTFGFQSPGLPKLAFGLVALDAGVGSIDPGVFPRYLPKNVPQAEFVARRDAARAVLAPALAGGRAVTRGLAAGIAALLFLAAALVAGGWRLARSAHSGRARPRRAPRWLPLLAGGLSAGLWLASPAVAEASAHVRPGLFPVLFWCFGLVLFLVAARNLGERERAARWQQHGWIGTALGLGLATGLATAGKLNGVLFAPLVPLLLWQLGLELRRVLVASLLAGVVAWLVFLSLAPGLWGDTLGGVAEILRGWRGDLAHQADVHTALRPSGRLHALWLALKGLVGEAGPLAGLFPHVGWLLLPLGLVALAVGARPGRGSGSEESVEPGLPDDPNAPNADLLSARIDRGLLVWCLGLLVGSGLILPLVRERYLMPMAAPAALALGLLFARLALELVDRRTRARD